MPATTDVTLPSQALVPQQNTIKTTSSLKIPLLSPQAPSSNALLDRIDAELAQIHKIDVQNIQNELDAKGAARVDLLKSRGFTNIQAEGLIALISDALRQSIESSTSNMVSNETELNARREMYVELAEIKEEIKQLTNNDFALLKAELDRIIKNVAGISEKMKDDTIKIQGGVRLDINLEKARIEAETMQLYQLIKDAGKIVFLLRGKD